MSHVSQDDAGAENHPSHYATGHGHGTGEDGMGGGNGTGGGVRSATRRIEDSTISSSNFGASGLGGAGNRQARHVGGTGVYGASASRNSDNDTDNNGSQQQDMRADDNAYGNYSSDTGPSNTSNPGRDDTFDTAGDNHAGGKIGMADKIKGSMKQVQGKLTKNPDLVQEGQAMKTGIPINDSNFSSGDGDRAGSTGGQAYGGQTQ